MTEKRKMKLKFDSPEGRAAKGIIRKIKEAGGKAFIVGGAVRDEIMGINPKDVDVATNFLPEDLVRVFGEARVNFVGESFGVAIVKHGEDKVEVATFREDGEYSDGRRPDTVVFSDDPETDSKRRDLTINALFFDPIEEVVLDFHGGLDDHEQGIIRTVGDPEKRFSEDFLRMLRTVRFASRFGFDIDEKVQDTIRKMAHNIKSISGERIFMEVDKMITTFPVDSLLLMRKLELLGHILPEVEALIGVEQPPNWHPEGHVWTHVMLILSHMETPAPSELAWTALLHDIGKPSKKGINDKGNICFHGHEEVSEEMAREILKNRFRCSNKFTNAVCDIIASHGRVADLSKMKMSKIRLHMARETIDHELAFCRLDALGKGSACNLDNFNKLMEIRHKFMDEPPVPPKLLSGHEVIDAGTPRGPMVGEMLRMVQELQLQGEISTKEEAIAFVKGRNES